MGKSMDKLTVKLIWEELIALWLKSKGDGNTSAEVERSGFLKAELRKKGYYMEMMWGEKALYPYMLPVPTPDLDIFLEQFDFPLKGMARVYKMHREKKGDSWKEMPTFQLYDFMRTKWDVWTDLDTDEDSALTDLLLTGFMLLTRLTEERKEQP